MLSEFSHRLLGKVVLDPDQQIQKAVRLLFATFREVRSATAVVKRFHREAWPFPRRIRRGSGKGGILWGALDHCRVIQILHNPRYVGAFVIVWSPTRLKPIGTHTCTA